MLVKAKGLSPSRSLLSSLAFLIKKAVVCLEHS